MAVKSGNWYSQNRENKSMNKEEANTLPNHWILTELGELGIIVSGSTPSTSNSQFWSGAIPWITPADLSGYEGKFISKGKRNISKEGLDHSSATLLPEGSLLFSSRAPIGYVVIAKNALATNQGFKNIIPLQSTFVDYLYYYLLSSKQMIERMASGTTFPELSASTFRKVPIPLPPFNEQKKIVNKIEELFSELDHAEKTLRKSKSQLELYRLACLHQTFKGKLKNVPFDSNLESIDGWSFNEIGEIFDFIGGGTPSKKQTRFWNGDINWASVKDIKGKYLDTTVDKISKEGLRNSSAKIATKGDIILVTRISPGKTIITNIETAINQDLKIVYSKFKLIPEFVYYLFQAYIKEITALSSGTTVKGINLDQLSALKILYPPLEEHLEIVDHLNYINSLIANFSKEIDNTLNHIYTTRHSILKKAFSGRLITQDEEDESAAELLNRIQAEKLEYLKILKQIAKTNPPKGKSMESLKTIVEVLRDDGPLSTKEVWQRSEFRDNIDKFYSALKKVITNGNVTELPRRGKESFLALTIQNEN
jgi:type I restriction enzyme S subunit